MVKVGIIGGTGLDDPHLLKNARDIEVHTPYGKPSSPLQIGSIHGVDVVLLARHGRKHTLMPSNVPFQANIHALKEQGCTHILATTACGSLREEIKPGDLVFLDQFIDRTTKRKQTFYEKDRVCHIPMADPFCPELRSLLVLHAKKLNLRHHTKGTVVTIEGPRFSSRAESNLFQSWKCDVINMSTVPEVVLAREAGLCYAAVAMSTDYDCWHESEEAVSIDLILKIMKQNADHVKELFVAVLQDMAGVKKACSCSEHIKNSVLG